MNKNIFYILSLFLFSCNMEKEVDLKLPEYESKMVVECYLVPGQPYRLSLFESVSYFEAPQLPTVDSALVIIKHSNKSDTLKFLPQYISGRLYNYSSDSLVPFDYSNTFTLEILDKKGRRATASTIIPVIIPIDNVTFQFNNDSLAFPLVQFTDDPGTSNYYRYQLQKISTGEEVTDYEFDDKLLESSQVSVGSNYNLEKGEPITVSIFNITKDYFDFLESVTYAVDANGNPFGQPAVIKTNVEGGTGIFTGIGIDQRQLVVP